jgi:hypothetical protein
MAILLTTLHYGPLSTFPEMANYQQNRPQNSRKIGLVSENPQSDNQTAASHRSDTSIGTITVLLARIQSVEKAQLDFQRGLKQLATNTA